jgi:DNA-binding transcriptional LysR family regulator
VPGAVARMRERHPGTEVSLVEAEPPASVDMLRAGDCDITLAFRYPDLPTPAEESWADLVVRPLLVDRLVGVVPRGHRLAGGAGPVDLAALAGERWIAGCPRCRGHLVERCERVGFTPRIDFATDDYPAVAGLVAAGLGVAVLPRLALEPVRSRGVAVVALRPAVHREVVALTLPDLAHVPAVDIMLGLLTRASLGRA